MGLIADFIVRILLYLAPMYFANSTAMLLGGKTPIDFGKKFHDGRPIFGKGKTFKGFFFGVSAGTVVAVLINYFFPAQALLLTPRYIELGFLLALGAILGDMAGSFIKRRMGMEPGKPAFFLDQLDFVTGAVLLGLALYMPTLAEIAVIVVLTLIVHRLANYLAYRIKLKRVPW